MPSFRPIVPKPTARLDGTPATPDTRIVKQRRHHHKDGEWEENKKKIIQLYIDEDKSAEAVIGILQADFPTR